MREVDEAIDIVRGAELVVEKAARGFEECVVGKHACEQQRVGVGGGHERGVERDHLTERVQQPVVERVEIVAGRIARADNAVRRAITHREPT